MKKIKAHFMRMMEKIWNHLGNGMQAKLIIIFLIVMTIPLITLTIFAWTQINHLSGIVREISVKDATEALTDSAIESLERMTTDTAKSVAEFLYQRDGDILYIADLEPTEDNYRRFLESMKAHVVKPGEWVLADDGSKWIPLDPKTAPARTNVSTNPENDDMDGFTYRRPDQFEYQEIPLYDEITFVDLNGIEQIKIVAADSPKTNYPMNPDKRDISDHTNTYVKAEHYYEALKELKPGEIYVSDVIGAYTRSNYIGMYTPDNVAAAAATRGYDIPYDPEAQSYAGAENPNGQRFEGIVRWATPVTDENDQIIGYVTLALNHDHIMEFVDRQTPMNERYTELPDAYDGNYAFIWDYNCRSICHPRHNSIVGYDPETGQPQIPWLESSIYTAWQESGIELWTDYVKSIPEFDQQSREKVPAPELTRAGLVGLDGRYLNNAPQCTGWMDLSKDGGSGSFYILWSNLYKRTTAAAIPYYTGQYAPSEANDFSRRGFGVVTIGAGLEDFTAPSVRMEEKLNEATGDTLESTLLKLFAASLALVTLVVLSAVWIASFLTGNIKDLIGGMSRFRSGERQFRFHKPVKDEFGILAESFDEMADSIVASVSSPLSIINLNRKIIYMNEHGLNLIGKTLDEITGSDYGLHSAYPEGTRYCPITALEQGHEAEILFDEKNQKYLRGTANYFTDNQGRRIGYIIVTTDVTDMVLEQAQREEQRILLDRVFSASPDMIWYQDASGRYLTVNPRFATIAGTSTDNFAGKTAEEILPEHLAATFISNDHEAMASTHPVYKEESIQFADGHKEILDSVRMPIFDSNKKLVGMLGYGRNVTLRVKIEDELRQTQTELEQAVIVANQANAHKGDFLARMSHEIRTPMNAIIGITNIVLKKLGTIDDNSKNINEIIGHMHQIDSSSQHLLGLLNDILDISKIEAGKIELAPEATELLALADTVASIINPRCAEKNIIFNTVFDTFEPSAFMCDSLRLRQVLINLLGNAVKFTPECGAVEFRIKNIGRKDGKTQIRFSVSDTGIGISEDSLSTIFQPFEQENSNITKKYGGTGLGLAISNRIVQLFGGNIEVTSQLGEGSEFSFVIWLTETTSEAAETKTITDIKNKLAGKRLMLVDDVKINRIIVSSMLKETGIQIDEADDGLIALEMFQQSPEYTYDMILMDIQMPNMDGYEASQRIRALNRADAKSVPIAALTANAFKEDMDKAMIHGMNTHIAKPVETERLMEVLFNFLLNEP